MVSLPILPVVSRPGGDCAGAPAPVRAGSPASPGRAAATGWAAVGSPTLLALTIVGTHLSWGPYHGGSMGPIARWARSHQVSLRLPDRFRTFKRAGAASAADRGSGSERSHPSGQIWIDRLVRLGAVARPV